MEHQKNEETERGGIILQTSRFEMKECNIMKQMSKPQPPPTPLAKTAAGAESVTGSLVYINNHKQTTSQLNHSIIGQQFDILGVLGTGCYGRTYKVVDKLRYFKQFALKRTKTHFQQSIKEAITLLELNNPCIIPVFSCWREQDSLFIETSLGDLSLQEILDNYGTVPENLFWTIAQDISYALDECFNKQIMHLDVKPSNILVVHMRYFGDIISNFDINKQASVVTRTLVQFNVSAAQCDVDNQTPNLVTYENLRMSGVPEPIVNGQKGFDGHNKENEAHELILSDLSEELAEEGTQQVLFKTTPTQKTPSEQGFSTVLSPEIPQQKNNVNEVSKANPNNNKLASQFTVTYEPPLQKLSCSNLSDLEGKCIFQLIDFGQAQKVKNEQFSECNCGDSAYVDYKFMQTSRPTFYSDLFSFGIMLLELITGIKLPVQGILFEKLRTQQWYECFPNNIFGTNLQDVIEYKADEVLNAQVQISVSIWRAIGDILSGNIQNIRQWRQKYWDYLEQNKRQDIYQVVEKFNQVQFDVQYEQNESRCIVLSKELLRQLQIRKAQKSAGPKLLRSKKIKKKHNNNSIEYGSLTNGSFQQLGNLKNISNTGFVSIDNFNVASNNIDNSNQIKKSALQQDKQYNFAALSPKNNEYQDQDDLVDSHMMQQSIKKNKSQAILSARRKELIFSQIQSLRDFIIKGGKYCKGNQQTFIKQDMMGSVTVLKTSDVILDQNQLVKQEFAASYGSASLVQGTEIRFVGDGRNISPDWQSEQIATRHSQSGQELLMDGALSFNDHELNQIFFQDDLPQGQKVNSFVHLSVLDSGEERKENSLSESQYTERNCLDAAGLCMHGSQSSFVPHDSDFQTLKDNNCEDSQSHCSVIASGVTLSNKVESGNNNDFFSENKDGQIGDTQSEPKELVLSNESKQPQESPTTLKILVEENKSESLWRMTDEDKQKNSVIQMGLDVTLLNNSKEMPERKNLFTPSNDEQEANNIFSKNNSKLAQLSPKNVKLILPDQLNKQSSGGSIFQQCKSGSAALLSGPKMDSDLDISTSKREIDVMGMSRRSSSEISLNSQQGIPYTKFEEISAENRAIDEGTGQNANFVLSEAVKVESDYSTGDCTEYSESVAPKTLQDAHIRSTRVFGSIFSAIETLTGIGTMVYFPFSMYREQYRTPTIHNLSFKDKNIISRDCSGQNILKSMPTSAGLTSLQSGQNTSRGNNLPPYSKKSYNKHLQFHELSDLNQFNFQGRFRPLSGNYSVLRKAELEMHGYFTPRGLSENQASQNVRSNSQQHRFPRWLLFSIFNSAFVQYAYVLNFLNPVHIKTHNSVLFKSKGYVLFSLFIAMIIGLHMMNRKNQGTLIDAIYRQIGTSGVYINIEKFLSSIYGFFIPIVMYFSNFCYFMRTKGDAKVNYFILNVVQDIFVLGFEKLVEVICSSNLKLDQKTNSQSKELKKSPERSQKSSKKNKSERRVASKQFGRR